MPRSNTSCLYECCLGSLQRHQLLQQSALPSRRKPHVRELPAAAITGRCVDAAVALEFF